MSIEETYKGMWSSDPSLLKSLLDAGNTILGLAIGGRCYTLSRVGSGAYMIAEEKYSWFEEFLEDWVSGYGLSFLIPPRPLVLEPKPLEWRKNTNDFNEHLCEDDYWTFSANSDGSWVIFHGNAYMGGEDNPTDGLSIDDAKAAIQEWRVNHLKSMLP